MVADIDQKVPLCFDCADSLGADNPKLPKYALANDLWLGRLPPALQGLSEGAWMLLALARPFIRRYGCLNDSGKFIPQSERIKAVIGNVCAFTQADGGSLLSELPPSKEDLIGRIVLAFVGTDQDLTKAWLESLHVSVGEFRKAFDFLHKHNYVYSAVTWNENAAQRLAPMSDRMGLPKCLANCVIREDPGGVTTMQREGPAEAISKSHDYTASTGGPSDALGNGGDHDVDDDNANEGGTHEYVAGIADEDLQLDYDRYLKHIETSLKKQELKVRKLEEHEQRVRESGGKAASCYKSRGGRAQLQAEQKALQRELNNRRIETLEADVAETMRVVDGVESVP